ncbi:MAG: hypothetical protein H6951_04245 [Zoogloeaceae bacterium]|nr:hypothetical protein [Zoogloeaceae bacterium]
MTYIVNRDSPKSLHAKKTRLGKSRAKSTPKEEGGGDTGWIEQRIRLHPIIKKALANGKWFLCAAAKLFLSTNQSLQ